MRILLISWLVFIPFLTIFLGINLSKVSGQCLKDQQSSLIQLKKQLVFNSSFSTKLVNWGQSSDCCQWKGVFCDEAGRVTVLDLSEELISGGINQSSSLFSLQFLQRLNLAANSFHSSEIPSRIGNLTNLRYLNLSFSGFAGQVPMELSSLTRLVTLDLSVLYFPGIVSLKLESPNLMMLVQNLTALTELYLDGVNISAQGSQWGQAISSSLPNLRVLSFSNCYLSGPIDSSLEKLQFLSVIRLDQNNLSAPVPEFFANFRNLTALRLSSCNLNGEFPGEILKVLTLQSLDLSNNAHLHGSFPEFPENGSLQNLMLSDTNFSGELPNSIGKLMNLSRIELSGCNFSGQIPNSMAKLVRLVCLDLSSNKFSGPIPSFQLCKNLTYIDLSHNALSGPVPSSYFDGLEKLVNIDLRYNSFNGSFPSSLFSLPSLQKIQLSTNQFGNQIAEFSIPASPLDTLDLSNNNLQGSIPKSFFELRNLNILSLSYNNFSGTMKLEMIQNLPNLTTLELSYNSLSIGADFSNAGLHSFPQLTVLKLASCKLQGFPDLRNQSRMIHLDLSDNQISGEIPNWIWMVGNGALNHLNLSSNFLRDLQKPYVIPSLSVLDLHSNQLLGEVPTVPGFLTYLDYSSNNFSSAIPDEIGYNLTFAYFFSLSNNSLTGIIPESLCNASYLRVLDLSHNNLNGSMPPCLIERTCLLLGVLNLRNNSLTGSISGIFPDNCTLQTLDLNDNKLKGEVPRSLANCQDLEVLNLGNNRISDGFPCFLKNSSSLRVLILRSNVFHGNISCGDTGHGNKSWEKLQIIDLALNHFNGTLSPTCFLNWKGMMVEEDEEQRELHHLHFEFLKLNHFYYQDTVSVTNKGLEMELVKILTVFTSIDFSGNSLEGEIPSTVGALKSLYVLNLSCNALTGPIPSTIGNLTQLGSLDLSRNRLSGSIPFQFVDLTFLSVLNLSYNKLTGRIPTAKQFATFTESSFLGNPGLCGPALNVSCSTTAPPDTSTPSSSGSITKLDWQFIFTGLGFGIGAGVIVGPLFFCKRASGWSDKYIEKLAWMIITALELKMHSEDQSEEGSFDETEDFDEEEMQDKASQRRYCVFCTKLDIRRQKTIHNLKCICHDSTPIYSSLSSSSSSSSSS